MRFGRKSIVAGTLAAIGIAVGVAVAVPVRQAPAAAASAQPNGLSVLNARSPGQRADGAQTNKRAPRMAMLSEADGPPAGLLAPASVSAAPIAAAAAAPAAAAAVPVAAAAIPAAGLIGIPATALAPALPAAAIVAGSGVPLAALAGVGGAAAVVPALFSGGNGGGGTSSVIAPVSAPAVPEPGTWLMMMVGFGVLGSSLRIRRKRSTQGRAGTRGLAA